VMSSISFRDSSRRLRFTSIMRRTCTLNYRYDGSKCQETYNGCVKRLRLGCLLQSVCHYVIESLMLLRYQQNKKGVN
jgi:hypothetical protein